MRSAIRYFSTLAKSKGFPEFTLDLSSHPPTKEALAAGVKAGFRSFDFGINIFEDHVKESLKGILDSGLIKREELFLSCKIPNDQKEFPQSYLKKVLTTHKLEYLDCLSVSWPLGDVQDDKIVQFPLLDTWFRMEDPVGKGLVHHLGIANFNVQLILDLMSYANILPTVNQIELHPYLVQKDLVKFLLNNNIIPQAANPLAISDYLHLQEESIDHELYKEPLLMDLASKYNCKSEILILKWHLQRSHVISIELNSNITLEETLKIPEIIVSEEDMKAIGSLNINLRMLDPKLRKEFKFIPLFD